MIRWHYIKDGELPDPEKEEFLGGPMCIVKTSEYSDGFEIARYGFSQGQECFVTIERPEPISDIAMAWVYVSEIVMVLDRMTGIISYTDAAFRKYLNNNQTDSAPRAVSVTTTIEMKTGEMSYE